jgi:hypothetical protein
LDRAAAHRDPACGRALAHIDEVEHGIGNGRGHGTFTLAVQFELSGRAPQQPDVGICPLGRLRNRSKVSMSVCVPRRGQNASHLRLFRPPHERLLAGNRIFLQNSRLFS